MRKTKEDLIKILQIMSEGHVVPGILSNKVVAASPELMADTLIKSGFVKIYEPREFWIVKEHMWSDLKIYHEDPKRKVHETIHVREVE